MSRARGPMLLPRGGRRAAWLLLLLLLLCPLAYVGSREVEGPKLEGVVVRQGGRSIAPDNAQRRGRNWELAEEGKIRVWLGSKYFISQTTGEWTEFEYYPYRDAYDKLHYAIWVPYLYDYGARFRLEADTGTVHAEYLKPVSGVLEEVPLINAMGWEARLWDAAKLVWRKLDMVDLKLSGPVARGTTLTFTLTSRLTLDGREVGDVAIRYLFSPEGLKYSVSLTGTGLFRLVWWAVLPSYKLTLNGASGVLNLSAPKSTTRYEGVERLTWIDGDVGGSMGVELVDEDWRKGMSMVKAVGGTKVEWYVGDFALLDTTVTVDPVTSPIYPAADAYVDSLYPNNNYGSSSYFFAGESDRYRGFMKFDLSRVPIPADAIYRATLKLYCVTATTQRVDLHSVDNDSWSEGTITWNNQPAHGGWLAAVEPIAGSWAAFYHPRLTDFVRAQIALDNLVSLCLKWTGAGYARFNPKEAVGTAFDPYLELEYLVGATRLLPPRDDAPVYFATPNTNYGAAPEAMVYDGTRSRVFLKFDLTDIPPNAAFSRVKLWLNLYIMINASSDNFYLHRVDNDDWDENVITWGNRPENLGVLASLRFFTVPNEETTAWFAFDLTSHVANEFENGNKKVSLMFYSLATLDRDMIENLRLKEYGDGGKRPFLELNYIVGHPPEILEVAVDNALVDRKLDDPALAAYVAKATRIRVKVRDNDGRDELSKENCRFWVRDNADSPQLDNVPAAEEENVDENTKYFYLVYDPSDDMADAGLGTFDVKVVVRDNWGNEGTFGYAPLFAVDDLRVSILSLGWSQPNLTVTGTATRVKGVTSLDNAWAVDNNTGVVACQTSENGDFSATYSPARPKGQVHVRALDAVLDGRSAAEAYEVNWSPVVLNVGADASLLDRSVSYPYGTLVDLPPSHDAEVRSADPDNNFGYGQTGEVHGAGLSELFLKFELPSLPEVSEAILHLFVAGCSGGVEVRVRKVAADGWNEGTITWNNRPAAGDLLASVVVDPASVYSWVQVDLTGWVENGRKEDNVVSVCLRGESDGDNRVSFYTKEYPAYRPRLEVRCSRVRDNIMITAAVEDNNGRENVLWARVSVRDPSGSWVLENEEMTPCYDVASENVRVFGFVYAPEDDAPLGRYSVRVIAGDGVEENISEVEGLFEVGDLAVTIYLSTTSPAKDQTLVVTGTAAKGEVAVELDKAWVRDDREGWVAASVQGNSYTATYVVRSSPGTTCGVVAYCVGRGSGLLDGASAARTYTVVSGSPPAGGIALPQKYYWVFIRVLDAAENRPIDGAVVSVFKEGRLVENKATELGDASFNLPAGSYWFRVEKENYVAQEFGLSVVDSNVEQYVALRREVPRSVVPTMTIAAVVLLALGFVIILGLVVKAAGEEEAA